MQFGEWCVCAPVCQSGAVVPCTGRNGCSHITKLGIQVMVTCEYSCVYIWLYWSIAVYMYGY